MRRGVMVVLFGLLACSCSRKEKEPPTPTPKESGSATTMSGIVDVPPVIPAAMLAVPTPPAPRSLSGKKVLHVGDSMVGGSWGLTRALEAKLSREGAKI